MPDLREFLVPDLGEGLADVTVVEWLVSVGEAVALNQPLCVVETAKATVEIPSPWSGAVVELGGSPGDTLEVGAVLARIDVEPAPGTSSPTPPGTSPAPAPPPTRPGTPAAPGTSSPTPPGTRATLVGYGPDPSLGPRRQRRRRTGVAAAPAGAGGARALAPPPVRKLALDLGVDLAAIAPGSGPGGTVTRKDVCAAASTSATWSGASPPAAPPSAPAVGGGPAAVADVVQVGGVRARIAQNLATSRQRIPDATCSVVADCTQLLELRATLGEAAASGGTPPVTPFVLVCRLLVLALRENPALNASWIDDGPAVRVHRSMHLGIGTATERGLLVPVVRDAERRPTRELAAEVHRLVAQARAGTLTPAELTGSTFTVSNFGALGLDEGIPVINYPEAAILGLGAIRQRPHVVDGEVVARPTATLTLAFDHRVADGAEAGRLLSRLRSLVEAPELALWEL